VIIYLMALISVISAVVAVVAVGMCAWNLHVVAQLEENLTKFEARLDQLTKDLGG